jgi:DNA mismatch endonuclease (patch repair protein)
MADHLTREKRSWNMSRIRGTDTGIEMTVRSYLFRRGFRYRKNVRELPGKPDIVLPKYRTVIFIHGCFWHMHEGCRNSTLPKSRQEFWKAKLTGNVKRDRQNTLALINKGWQVLVIWECEILENLEETMKGVISKLLSSRQNERFR